MTNFHFKVGEPIKIEKDGKILDEFDVKSVEKLLPLLSVWYFKTAKKDMLIAANNVMITNLDKSDG